jgi:hypothetical protein
VEAVLDGQAQVGQVVQEVVVKDMTTTNLAQAHHSMVEPILVEVAVEEVVTTEGLPRDLEEQVVLVSLFLN